MVVKNSTVIYNQIYFIFFVTVSPAQIDDEWATVRKARKFLIKEMDAERVMPHLTGKQVFTDDEERQIMRSKDPEKRTEALLDILECKSSNVYEMFIEMMGEVYPHIYLMLTDHGQEDDDGEHYLSFEMIYVLSFLLLIFGYFFFDFS